MRKVKWIFFAYLVLIALIIAGIGLSFAVLPERDPYTLYSTYGSNIRGLDPAKISDTTSASVAGYIFECLYNYDYVKRPYTIAPELAEAMPDVSPDGMTFTIRIKKGIHYFDPNAEISGWEDVRDAGGKLLGRKGPEVTAADFIYAWKRICDFHLDSQNYSAIFQGKVRGVDDWWEYTKNTAPESIDWDKSVEGIQATDPNTLVIKLVQPFPQLIYNLAHLPTSPVSREAVKFYGENFRYKPIGTGPYMQREHLQDERIVFEANPIYRGRPDAESDAKLSQEERLPHVKRVRLDYFEEDLPAWALFVQGLVDVSGIPKDTYSTAIDNRTRGLTPQMQAKGIELIKTIEPTVFFMGFNMTDPLVGKNKPLRQAMSMAFDRQEFISLMLNGRGIPAKGPIPPEFPTYDANVSNPNTDFNIAAAREKIKEAEQINGGPIPPISFLLPGTETSMRQIGELFKSDMAQVGLDIRPDYRTWARFQEMVDSKQAQFFDLGWEADYPDEQTFLQLFYSKNAAPGPNSSNYHNPAYDSLYEKAMVMNPGPERVALYKQMIALVQDDCPVIFNCIGVAYTLHYNWVGNTVPNVYAHGTAAWRTLDFAKRQQSLSHR